MHPSPRPHFAAAPLLPLCALALAACTSSGGPAPPPIAMEQVTRGRHVTLHADPSRTPCPGSIDQADDYVERAAAFFGVPAPSLDAYWYASIDTPSCETVRPNADCALVERDATLGTLWFQQHEAAHVIAGQLGTAPAFLAEGVAELLSFDVNAVAAAGPVDRALHLEDNLEGNYLYNHDAPTVAKLYAASADFLRSVVARHGIETVRRWYSAVRSEADTDTIRRAYADAAGESLDDALAAWRAEPATYSSEAHLVREECTAEWVPAHAAPVAVDGAWSCNAANSSTYGQQQVDAVDLADDGLYLLRESASRPLESFLASCAGTVPALFTAGAPTSTSESVRLFYARAGRVVRWSQPDTRGSTDAPTTSDLTQHWSLERVGGNPASCAEATGVDLASVTPSAGSLGTNWLSAPHAWRGGNIGPVFGAVRMTWLTIAPAAADRTVAVRALADGGSGSSGAFVVTACRGPCDAPHDCVNVPTGAGSGGTSIAVPAGESLRFELRAPDGLNELGLNLRKSG